MSGRDGNADLVVNLGDITADGMSAPGELDAASRVFATLGRPMRFLPGNHDIGDNPLETGPSSDHPLDVARLVHYHGVFGPDRWEFEADGWQIVGLNAQLFATGTDEEEAQFAWLEGALRQRGGPSGVLLHKPRGAHLGALDRLLLPRRHAGANRGEEGRCVDA